MHRTLAILLLLFILKPANSQSNPSGLFEDLYSSIKQSDVPGFTKLHLSSAQVGEIIAGLFMGNLSMDSVKLAGLKPNQRSVDSFYNVALKSIIYKLDSLGADIGNSSYFNCRYQIFKSPQNFFISMKGDLILKNKKKYISIGVREAVLVDDLWRIISLDSISLVNDSSDLKLARISEFQTIEKTTKITSVKLEKSKNEPEPPPAPPIDIRRKPVKKKN